VAKSGGYENAAGIIEFDFFRIIPFTQPELSLAA
jgi:hypothetical protein